MEKEWTLGKDLHAQDSLFDGFTFQELIDTLCCNEPVIDEVTVRRVANEMLKLRLTDFIFLLDNNIHTIIEAAQKSK